MKQCTITNNNLGQWLLSGSGMDYFPDYYEQEKWKHQYGLMLQAFEKGEATLDELALAAEGRLRAWFFRSVEHLQLPLLHPLFPVFASMLLNEEYIRRIFPAEIVERMVAKYGRQKGQINGSYWIPVGKHIKGNFEDVLYVKDEKLASVHCADLP